jgi:endonuclease YncB( thermonuclease family)
MRLITIVIWLALTSGADAATLVGRVVGVADGDSVTVLDADQVRHKVRLSAIDAPEKGQAFGNRAKQHLSELVFQKEVSVHWRKRDRYGRIVGKVMVQSPDCPGCPKNLDVGQAQLSVGLAWWYRKHASEQSPDGRGRYESEEMQARARRVGLWRDAAPVPPWEFRKAQAR